MDLKCLNSAAPGSIPQPSAMIVKIIVTVWTPWKNQMRFTDSLLNPSSHVSSVLRCVSKKDWLPRIKSEKIFAIIYRMGKKNPTSEYFENCFYSPLAYKADCMSSNILLVCYHSNRKQTILKSEYYESKALFYSQLFSSR